MKQYEDGHLGGCVIGGDLATFYPKTWDFFMQMFQVNSVFDLGCGEGHSLAYFKTKCEKVFGVDGCEAAVNASAVKDLIKLHDFTKGSIDPGLFDMVWCCEFLEHIEEKFKDNFLFTIQKTQAKYVLLTHAHPGQGGYHHVNCQQPSYWIHELDKLGYELSPTLTRMCRTVAWLEVNSEVNHFACHGLVFVKKEKKEQKQDAIISWASGSKFCKLLSVKAFVNSINSSGFDGDKLMFTHDMDIDDREWFADRDFQVIDVDPRRIHMLLSDRHLIWSDFLETTNYRHVLLLDSKDVILQTNPIPYLEKMQKGFCFVGEGKLHHECAWNMGDQGKLQNKLDFPDNFSNWEVVCGGTILGYASYVKNIIKHVWSMTENFNCHSSDQATLNFLYHRLYQANDNCCFVNPRINSLVATADLPIEPAPKMIEGILYHSGLNEPYSIWHQWDRTQHRDYILEKYS